MGTDSLQAPWKKIIWYTVLTALGVIVLFPVYMTLVRALSTPAEYVQAGQPPWPVDVQWGVFARAFELGDLGPKLLTSAVVTVLIVGAAAGHLDPRGLRLRLPRVPLPACPVRGVHGHA